LNVPKLLSRERERDREGVEGERERKEERREGEKRV